MTTTTTNADAVADVLDKAADHLDRVGHHKGYLYDETQAEDGTPLEECRVCAAGAILAAAWGTPRYPDRDPEINLSDAALHELEEAIQQPIASWNDEEERQQEQVTEALRGTATRLRAEAAK